MAPGSRQRQQQQTEQQQQQLSSPAAAIQQAHQLLQRLATAPDLSLFRDKCDRVKELARLSSPASEELLLLLAASVTNGLRHLQPLLLQLDLPKSAVLCIQDLAIRFFSSSVLVLQHPASCSDTEPSNEWVKQQKLAQQVADTGEHQLQIALLWPCMVAS
jgi:hypothetical protein